MHSILIAGAMAAGLIAQQQQPPHQHGAPADGAPAWHLMQDGVAFLTFNRQGGPRGDREVISQNWWMGMASRPVGKGELTLSLMLSLDPLTQYGDGYALLFQSGEAYEGRPIIDRQHPHDFLMQASVLWRVPIGDKYTVALSAAPVGEPTLGPVAFMHRKSSAENPSAPLGHHTLDSTHIAHGVVAASGGTNEWTFEASVFRGREPDAQRWDLMDPGPLDSWAARVWHRPTPALEFQASFGFLNNPEELEPVDVKRTTFSGSWLRDGENWTAVTAAFGRNDKIGGANVAWLAEITQRLGRTTVYGRGELFQPEIDLLLTGTHGHIHAGEELRRDWVSALTAGATRDLTAWRGFDLAAGGDVTIYGVPGVLRPAYGDSPVSFHVFLRVRPPAPMGRMWNHVMSRGH